MTKSYERAGGKVHEMVTEAMRRWHPALIGTGVNVDALFVREYSEDGELLATLTCGGYPAAATMAVVSLKHRALGCGDALLTIDEATWEVLPEPERWALLDHELTHLEVVADGGGTVIVHPETGELVPDAKLDDLGRPKLRIRRHDIVVQGFREVMARHKRHALESHAVEACRGDDGQYFWSWAKPADEELREAIADGVDRVTVSGLGRSVEFDAAAGKRLRDAARGLQEAHPAE